MDNIDGVTFPRLLVQHEIEWIRERAVQHIANAALTPENVGVVEGGMELMLCYRLIFGQAHPPQPKCGIKQGDLPPCHLLKGHTGDHCCVIKWANDEKKYSVEINV